MLAGKGQWRGSANSHSRRHQDRSGHRRETEGKKAINDTKQDAKAIKPEIQNRRTLENMRGW